MSGHEARPPVVFLHGAMSDRRAWAGQAERLAAAGRSVSNLDLPGHGARAGEGGGRDLAGLAAGVRQAALAHGAPVLVGWSLGAAVAMRLALDGADLAGLVLVGATPQAVADEGFAHALTPSAAKQRDQGLRAGYPATARLFARQVAPEDEGAKALVEEMALACPPETARAVFDAAWTDGVTRELDHLTTPSVLIHGDADRVVPIEAGRYLERTLPGSRGLHVLEGVGHAPQLSAPDLFAGALGDALESLAAHAPEVPRGDQPVR